MPDFEVTLTHTGQTREAWVKSVTIMDATRNQAIIMGMTELLKWCQEEARTNPEAVPIPPKAYDYWESIKNTGGPIYEIQSNLEIFGLTFGIKPIEETTAVEVIPPKGRPRAAVNGNGKPAHREFKDILQEQLQILQARQKELSIERKAIQEEYEGNQAQITQMVQYLTLAAPQKKRGRPKADAAERTEQG